LLHIYIYIFFSEAWDCAIAPTEEGAEEGEVMPCLIMGEVMPGSKCVAPSKTNKWVSLWELNKMRRNEPMKATGLW
jgi:hypothetical protein